jgi:FixJ family two-component response regulator
VLLEDDDDSLRRALARTIRLAGFDVEPFPSVEALLARHAPEAEWSLTMSLALSRISPRRDGRRW